MSDLTDIAARTRRFRDAVRAFTPPSSVRHAKLIPMKGGIIELRQKGTSLGVIRELLATVGVAVSTATTARSRGGEPQFSVSTTPSTISLADALPFRIRSECNLPPFRQRTSR
jgi:hypothetical protein